MDADEDCVGSAVNEVTGAMDDISKALFAQSTFEKVLFRVQGKEQSDDIRARMLEIWVGCEVD